MPDAASPRIASLAMQISRDALWLLALCVAVLIFIGLAGYLRQWRTIMSRRAVRSLLRGGMLYVFGKRGQRRVHGWRMFYRMRVEVMLRSKIPIRGISQFPTARLWVDSEAFPRVKKLIRRARHTVVIQMFIWKDDRLGREMAEALCSAADRGVRVSVSKEAVGDFFEFHQDFLGTRHKSGGVWKKFWSHPRIQIMHETCNDHAKVFIIDDRILLITGMNIADEYHEDWHDYMVELRGNSFVERYLTGGDIPGSARPAAYNQAGNDWQDARLVINSGRRKEIRPAVMTLLRGASNSIVLEHSYLSDAAVIDLLISRSLSGVRIVIILPQHSSIHQYANMQAIGRLLSEGDVKHMSVFLYPRMMHGKILLVDRRRAFIGSANLMTSSLDEMGEVNVLLEGRTHAAIRKLRGILRDDVLKSTPVSKPPRFRWLWRWMTWLKL
ncbi:phosphatidylserine/phosphatidylglycerophosphate/cardiolipin synthase family protein [Candidatus Peregrinibacteria bacterium]|nr:phosphatidylserine/phosphatidylglycerophosphate/cardiolipin synthase family protein [Candidatus Peregrinibacteria bacterium]